MPPNADARYLQSRAKARERVRAIFANRDVPVAAHGETRSERINRIAEQVIRGHRTFDDVRASVDRIARQRAAGYQPPDPADPTTRFDPIPAEQPRDFYREARALFPWLDNRLAREFATAWTETGSTELAWSRVQQGSTFRRIYGAIIRDDGTLRMSPMEYHAVVDGYDQRFARYGLNPSTFRGRYDDMIAGDVSPDELEGRLQGAWEGISQRLPATRRWYADNYGLDLSDEAIFASFIDPDVGTAVLERRISNAQIGGAAARFNFQRSLQRVEELAAAGVTGETADRFYRQAAADLPAAAARSQRHNRGGTTVGDLEDVGLLGDPAEQRRLMRGLDDEASLFTGSDPAAGDREGRRSGLTQR